MLTLKHLLRAAVDQQASDLHLVAGAPPCLRVGGKVLRLKSDILQADDIKQLVYAILTETQKNTFEENKELDFGIGIKDVSRFRGNICYQLGGIAAVFRRIPNDIPSLEKLNMPAVVSNFTQQKSGLVLVTGATGSGKTTTIAAMLDKINSEESATIVTLEDPIEYVHPHKKAIVKQREIGTDTDGFNVALKHLLRQDPDYCLIGEMRDLDTIEAALKVAETGHLVFATLHTNSAIETINRIIQAFPGGQQERVRVQLSFVLQGIISQQLLSSTDGALRLALEVLVPTPGIRNLIREDKLHQIKSLMQMGQNQTGMITMNQSLMSLLLKRHIDMKTAFQSSPDPDELDRLLRKAGL
ncbi:MAG: type IV pilus twitching motility protein PilT [Bdellovibrionales bacterium]|nr:type IV pilus twitching motility protein PilT [Bdellovibrionales bacterium]